MTYLKRKFQELWIFLEPEGSSSRVFIGLYMAVTGAMRGITGNTAGGDVNVFSARFFGLFLLLGGLILLVTTRQIWRCHMPGRTAAVFCAGLWLLIIANAWGYQAWVSISGCFIFVLALGNEVRIHE